MSHDKQENKKYFSADFLDEAPCLTLCSIFPFRRKKPRRGMRAHIRCLGFELLPCLLLS